MLSRRSVSISAPLSLQNWPQEVQVTSASISRSKSHKRNFDEWRCLRSANISHEVWHKSEETKLRKSQNCEQQVTFLHDWPPLCDSATLGTLTLWIFWHFQGPAMLNHMKQPRQYCLFAKMLGSRAVGLLVTILKSHGPLLIPTIIELNHCRTLKALQKLEGRFRTYLSFDNPSYNSMRRLECTQPELLRDVHN